MYVSPASDQLVVVIRIASTSLPGTAIRISIQTGLHGSQIEQNRDPTILRKRTAWLPTLDATADSATIIDIGAGLSAGDR